MDIDGGTSQPGIYSSVRPIPDTHITLLSPFPLFQVSPMGASFDGLINNPVKGQTHRIDTKHMRTWEAVEANRFQDPRAARLRLWHVK